MQDTEKCQIQGYYELKSTFSQFAMLCEDQLIEENNLIINFESVQDITMDLAVFGQPLEISFSMTTNRKDTALGKLHFTRVPHNKKRQTVMTLYFNKYGFVSYSLDGPPSLHCILDKDSIQMIFAHLLVSYVRKNQLSYLGDIEIEADRMGDAFLTEH
jgi:hypothetical protein